MSVKFLNWAFQLEGLNPTQKVILIALADNADDEGHCFPSMATLCRKTGLSAKNTIRNNLKILIEKGYLSVNERVRSNGSKTSNNYTLGGSKFEGGVVQNLRGGGSSREGGVGILNGGAIEPPSEPPINIKENILEEEFKEVRKAYKSIGKSTDNIGNNKSALKTFTKLLSKKIVTKETILESFKSYDLILSNKDFAPQKKHLSTYLNNDCWNDYETSSEKVDIDKLRLDLYRKDGQWLDSWGEKPNE